MSEIKPGCGLEREWLYKVVPLSAPYTINIVTSTVCNFRCVYCAQSLENNEKQKLGMKPELMEMATFERILGQIQGLKQHPKSIFLYGVGEPLCNPYIEEMVAAIKHTMPDVTVSFISNGALLTEERSLALIDAGLDILRISIQGLSDEIYIKTCGVDVDFSELVRQLKFYHDHEKKGNKLFVKVIDTALKEGEEQTFYRLFEDISDRMYIEKEMPIFEGVSYSEDIKNRVIQDRYGNEHPPRIVCPMTFFTLSIMPDGEVRPCDNLKNACELGNIQDKSLAEIWESSSLRDFWKMQLEDRRGENSVCRLCVAPDDVSHKEDELDDYREEILGRLE